MKDYLSTVSEHISKYRSLVPSLSLLIYLADTILKKNMSRKVDEESLVKAIRFCEYLESHARRVYADKINPKKSPAHLLGHKIQDGILETGFTESELKRKEWSGLKNENLVRMAIKALVECNWIKAVKVQTDGKSKIAHYINPKIYEKRINAVNAV